MKKNIFSINYLGHKISARGLEKALEKITAVINARVPENISELVW